ncbi:hypothetical protein [[Acholeplasma] multilocale]|uniref:hypothetical protein n=1 Tax=[Acholeplasma] multilocale TaxID=264638 RepID=UPI00047DCC51|nr:hypothetical protein [[Acholeplasma] multilocale]
MAWKKRKEISYHKEGVNTIYQKNEFFFQEGFEENILLKILFTKKYKIFGLFTSLTIKKLKTYCSTCLENRTKIYYYEKEDFMKPNKRKFICTKCLGKKIEEM